MCIPSTTRCTSLSSLLFILIFNKSHTLFLHILFVLHILLFCTFLYSIAHFTSYFFFYLYIYIYSCVVLLLYNFFFNSLHCPLSGPDLTYISLLIIPCIIYHVTNKETLNHRAVVGSRQPAGQNWPTSNNIWPAPQQDYLKAAGSEINLS